MASYRHPLVQILFSEAKGLMCAFRGGGLCLLLPPIRPSLTVYDPQERLQVWFWRFKSDARSRVHKRQAVAAEYRKKFAALDKEAQRKFSDAKAELGLWSDAGIGEGRKLFWGAFEQGKVFGRRQTFWDAFVRHASSHLAFSCRMFSFSLIIWSYDAGENLPYGGPLPKGGGETWSAGRLSGLHDWLFVFNCPR